MRALLFSLLCLLFGCSAPPAPTEPPVSLLSLKAATLAEPAVGEVSLQVGAITVRLGGVHSYCGTMVHPENVSEGVTLLGYSFAAPGTWSSVVNPIPSEAALTAQVPVGTKLRTLDALNVLFTATARPTAYSAIDEIMPIVVVPYRLRPEWEPWLVRPTAIGSPTNPWIAYMRQRPWVIDTPAWRSLPSVIDVDALPVAYGTWNRARPQLATSLDRFAGYCGELWTGWGTASFTPAKQHPGYGRTLSFQVSEAMCMMLSKDDAARRHELARRLAQWGADLAGAFASGRRDYANGGHMQARKALVVLSGYLLDAPWIDASTLVPGVFAEDHLFYREDGAAWGAPFPATWVFGYRGHTEAPRDLNLSAAQWSSSTVFYLTGYFPHVCGSQVGTALAMRLLGLTGKFSPAQHGMIAQWMQGPPQAARDAMTARAANLGGFLWGRDYSEGSEDFCRRAWEAYAR